MDTLRIEKQKGRTIILPSNMHTSARLVVRASVVPLVEALDTACRVNELLRAGEERMAC